MLDMSQILFLGVVAALGYAIFYTSLRRDPREPPLVHNGIPVIGHLIGMMRDGVGYWGKQAKKHPRHPIITLDSLFTKFYVISSPDLMLAVQRHNKSLSFEPLLFISAHNIAGITNPKALDLLRDRDAGGHGLGSELMHAMTPTLVGESLDTMNIRMAQLMRPFIDDLGQSGTVDLYKWCKDAIVAASTDATYGPLNPYKDPEIIDAWWDFEDGLAALMANTLPWLIARKPWAGRNKVARAILKYLEKNGPEKSSKLTKVRLEKSLEAGISTKDYAQLEVAMLIAFVSNTVPATFWCIFEICSRTNLLEQVRDEIKANALSVTEGGTHSIELAAIRDQCPLLLSTFQEVLRFRSISSPTRFVSKDTLIADKYLLKAGSLVSMASVPMGQRPEVWGDTASVFDERRFMKNDDQSDKKKDPRRAGGFMAFGISPTICPGRHFAASEILLLTAMIILRYDITPVDGVWNAPPTVPSMVAITGPVKSKFPVNVKHRKEYKGVKWDFHVQEAKSQFSLVIG
ncbi:hypothetical protein N7462_001844 [Penicillium macrosclerotiorum]|uniref:uncharacterized protein n=1 Tax=Penicillium macrosclerotiorum TaxID=303699 RepID=UPI0025469671|nr:uncharacterized protein N7462_001844 [Penicillium macrosclerotiorum]KAJ5692421.1 hypothetical protein N7462_001844 [Penicillium macrosclerotiorum]